jgi:hypothetical protein
LTHLAFLRQVSGTERQAERNEGGAKKKGNAMRKLLSLLWASPTLFFGQTSRSCSDSPQGIMPFNSDWYYSEFQVPETFQVISLYGGLRAHFSMGRTSHAITRLKVSAPDSLVRGQSLNIRFLGQIRMIRLLSFLIRCGWICFMSWIIYSSVLPLDLPKPEYLRHLG